MKDQFHDIAHIEKYLEGRLNVAESEAFEHLLTVNSEFAEKVSLCEAAIKEVKDEGLRVQLKGYHEELFAAQKKKVGGLYYYIGIAASLLLMISTIFILTNRTNSNEALFSSYFEPYPNLVTTRNNTTTPFGKGMESYSHHNYEKALKAFDEVDESGKIQEDFIFYKGISYLALYLPNKAIPFFKKLEGIEQYDEQCTWYLAMAYLNLEDIENTRKQLLRIQENSFKYTEARQLLKELDNLYKK